MPGRKYLAASSSKYRFGFNGKENDNDVKGEGNEQDYGMRIYDTRIGKFLSVDPLTKSYAFLTPYAFAENDILRCVDLDGLEKLIIHEVYDKFGRKTQTELSGIRDKGTKEAVNLDLASKMGVPLAKDDVYILRHRDNRNGSIFFEGNAGKLSNANIASIKNAPTVKGDETDDLPPGTMQQGEPTSRGRFFFSPLINNNNNEFFEGQSSRNYSSPVEGSNSMLNNFVSGTMINGEPGKSYGLNSSETTTSISKNVEGYITKFKKENSLNVAFVDQITITVPNNDNMEIWNSISNNLSNKYNTNVTILVNKNIESIDAGVRPEDMGPSSSNYANIKYNVSGVRDGNKQRAATGAQ